MIRLDKLGQQSQMPTSTGQEKQMGKASLETEKSAALSAAHPRVALLRPKAGVTLLQLTGR